MNAPEIIILASDEGVEAARSVAALTERARSHPTSKRYAIHARCGQCEAGDDDGGWRNRVRACAASACSLHPVRPYQDDAAAEGPTTADADDAAEAAGFDPIAKARANPKSRALAIKAYCWACQGGGKQPNVQAAIAECEVTHCAIHHVRPYRTKKPASAERAAPLVHTRPADGAADQK